MIENSLRKPAYRAAFQASVGAALGMAAMFGFLTLADGSLIDFGQPDVAVAVCAGVIYVLIGLMVALGAAVPKAGSGLLNVENAEELIEERPRLLPSAATFVLIGLFLILLASAPRAAEAIGRGVTLALAGALLVSIILISVSAARRMDELTRQLGYEASMLAINLLGLMLGIGAIAVAAGETIPLSPLLALGVIALVQLVATFWVTGRRGLLTPRAR